MVENPEPGKLVPETVGPGGYSLVTGDNCAIDPAGRSLTEIWLCTSSTSMAGMTRRHNLWIIPGRFLKAMIESLNFTDEWLCA